MLALNYREIKQSNQTDCSALFLSYDSSVITEVLPLQ